MKKSTRLGTLASIGSALLLAVGCAEEEPEPALEAFGCMFDNGLFRWCGEYRGVPAEECKKSGGIYYDKCPDGWVGKCEVDANVNPRVTYVYGDDATERAVEAVCPGGRVTLNPSGTGGTTGIGGTGGASSTGGSAGKSTGGAGAGAAAAAGGSAGSSVGPADCRDAENGAAEITSTRAELTDAPVAEGGTIVPGTYHLTELIWYGAPMNFVAERRIQTLEIASETNTVSLSLLMATGPGELDPSQSSESSYTYEVDGTTLVFQNTCGGTIGSITRPTYTAMPGLLYTFGRSTQAAGELVGAFRYEQAD